MISLIVISLFFFSIWWLVKIILSPELKYHSFWYKVKAKIIFWAGDVRLLNSFPWITWASINHNITLRQARDASSICRPGDIGLHRDSGFLSNLCIPGCFKHAWICVEDHYCVEAMSEGVIKRDEMVPLVSDYAMILRPRDVSEAEIQEAVMRANMLVGSDYDANFNFDFETENANLFPQNTRSLFGWATANIVHRATRDFQGPAATNLTTGKPHMAFSCTEVAGFSWYHKAQELNIVRNIYAGRPAIIADDFLKMNFDIVYANPDLTLEWAKANGMHKEGLRKIAEYLSAKECL
jgi:hypothetical protein